MAAQSDPYAELGLGPGATPAEIRHAFRRRLRAHHPDTRDIGDDDAGERSDAALQRLLAAYAALHRADADSRDTDRPAPATRVPRPGSSMTPTVTRRVPGPASPGGQPVGRPPLLVRVSPVRWQPAEPWRASPFRRIG